MTAHDELLKIHTILMAPGDCPPIEDNDTLTVRRLKDLIIWQRHQRQMAFGPQWNGAREVGPTPTTPQIAAMQQSQQGEIVAGKVQEPHFKDVDVEWLRSVLRHADKNPDYFPEVQAGKYTLDGDSAEVIAELYAATKKRE